MLIVSLIILMLVIFGAMIFMFQKIMKQNVTLATKHLDELSQDHEAKEKRLAKQIEEARQKSQELILQAQDEAEKLKAEILHHTEIERDSIIKQARTRGEEMIEQAEKSRHALLEEIESRIAKEAVTKAVGLIPEVLPENIKKSIHGEWMDDLVSHGFNQLRNLNIPSDVTEAKVSSAMALGDEQRKKLSAKLKEILARDMRLIESVDPTLVAGIVITFGSLVFDGSLKNKIKEKAR